jgi:hypothetical protein
MSEESVQSAGRRRAIGIAKFGLLLGLLSVVVTPNLIRVIDHHRGGNLRQRALIEYLAEVNRYRGLESASVDAFNAVVGENYQADADTAGTLRDAVLPGYRELVTGLERIEPASEDTARLHDELLAASKNQLRGFEYVFSGFQRQDLSLLHQGNELVQKAKLQMAHYRSSLKTAADGLSVQLHDLD